MGKTILITGGAASGKSRWAATYFEGRENVLYLSVADKTDRETAKRIEYGCKQHGVKWDMQTGVNSSPAEKSAGHECVIFDNLAAYTSSVMIEMYPYTDEISDEGRREIEERVIGDITALYEKVSGNNGSMIVITLETGCSVIPDNRSQAIFREILGNVNQRIANMSGEVYFSASGIQFKIKG